MRDPAGRILIFVGYMALETVLVAVLPRNGGTFPCVVFRAVLLPKFSVLSGSQGHLKEKPYGFDKYLP